MIRDYYIENLADTLRLLDEGNYRLNRSYQICEKIGLQKQYTDEEYDAFEALTSRYARVSDMILQKAFRSLDKVELEEGGTLIDAVNRAHKRGLIESVQSMREIRDLRNMIAHEYNQESLLEIFKEVLKFTPQLFTIINNLKDYSLKYINT